MPHSVEDEKALLTFKHELALKLMRNKADDRAKEHRQKMERLEKQLEIARAGGTLGSNAPAKPLEVR